MSRATSSFRNLTRLILPAGRVIVVEKSPQLIAKLNFPKADASRYRALFGGELKPRYIGDLTKLKAAFPDLLGSAIDSTPVSLAEEEKFQSKPSATDLAEMWQDGSIFLLRVLSAIKDPANSKGVEKSCSAVSKQMRVGLFYHMPEMLQTEAPSSSSPRRFDNPLAGIIIDPNHPSVVVKYAAKGDMYTNKKDFLDQNKKSFPSQKPGQLRDLDSEISYFNGLASVVNATMARNNLDYNPFSKDQDFSQEIHFYWNEIYSRFSGQAVIGVFVRSLKRDSAIKALNLLEHFPECEAVKFSYLTNELIPLSRRELEIFAGIHKDGISVLDLFCEKLREIFPHNVIKTAEYKLVFDQMDEGLAAFLRSYEIFSEDIFFHEQLADGKIALTVPYDGDQFLEFCDSFKAKSMRENALANSLFELFHVKESSIYESTPHEFTPVTSESKKAFAEKINKKISARLHKNIKSNVEYFGGRKNLEGEEINPEAICFAFAHPLDASVECLALFYEGKNRCIFYDKASGNPIGEMPRALVASEYGEWKTGLVNYIRCTCDFRGEKEKYERDLLNFSFSIYLAGDRLAIKPHLGYGKADGELQEFVGIFQEVTQEITEYPPDKFFWRHKRDKNFCIAKARAEAEAGENLGWRFDENGQIIIRFPNQKVRDNIIRAFNGDKILPEYDTSLFTIDPHDEAGLTLVLRKEFVEKMHEIDPINGCHSQVFLVGDLSKAGRVREINFANLLAGVESERSQGAATPSQAIRNREVMKFLENGAELATTSTL